MTIKTPKGPPAVQAAPGEPLVASSREPGRARGARRLTLGDMAEALQVSTATVSLALRDSPLVAPATRERIKAHALAAGYVYNRSAAALRTARSNMIGVAVHDILNPYFAEVFRALEDELVTLLRADATVPLCAMLRPGQLLFTYLHLAPDPVQTKGLVDSGAIAIAYETVTDANGGLPLLAPMSEVAGRMAPQAGAHCLEKAAGGRGVLLAGVPGVTAGRVLVIGGGVAGTNAARVAVGMGAEVTILERNVARIRQLDDYFNGRVRVLYSTVDSLERLVVSADLVIGAVLVPGAAAPKLVTRQMLRTMPDGAVVVDIAIDQGGCMETSRPTTHAEPTYIEEGIVHYCVANMPGAVARTSTFALNNATLPFVLALADKGWRRALAEDRHLRNGLNVHSGRITYKAVSEALGLPFTPAEEALEISY